MKKMLFLFAMSFIIAACGYWAWQAYADDPDCVTCEIDYYPYQLICILEGDICLPDQSEQGQYYFVYKPENVQEWGQYMLDSAPLICESGCNGFTFRVEVECEDRYDYYFWWDDSRGEAYDDIFCVGSYVEKWW